MSSLRILPPYQFIVNKALGVATFDTTVQAPPAIPMGPTDIKNMHNIALELAWTGNPTGTFKVLGSVTGQNWVDIGATVNSPNNALGSALVDLNQLSFPLIAIKYIGTAGAGQLNAWISAKAMT